MKLLLKIILSIALLFAVVACFSDTKNPDKLLAQEFTAKEFVAKEFTANVMRVVDGDTVWVRDQHGLKRKLRLANIDAPELDQAYGEASRQFLNQLIEGKKVDVLVIAKDRYKREVAVIIYAKQDINLRQVENGMAWHYISFAKEQQDPAEFQRYAMAEQNAQQHSLGLWKKDDAIAPWQFRRVSRQKNN